MFRKARTALVIVIYHALLLILVTIRQLHLVLIFYVDLLDGTGNVCHLMINVRLRGFLSPCSLLRLLGFRGSTVILREHHRFAFILSNFFLILVLKGEV